MNGIKLTTKEICHYFGGTRSKIKEWGLIPTGDKGQGKTELYDLKHVVNVFKERINPDIVKEKSGEVINIKTEEAKYKKQKARLAELHADEQEGKLTNADLAFQGYADFFTMAKTNLMGFHSKMAKILENSDANFISKTIESEIRNILNDWADEIEKRKG